jgi:hypothetical protein
MLVFNLNIFLQYQAPNLQLSWDNNFVVIPLQGFLIILYVGECLVALFFQEIGVKLPCFSLIFFIELCHPC